METIPARDPPAAALLDYLGRYGDAAIGLDPIGLDGIGRDPIGLHSIGGDPVGFDPIGAEADDADAKAPARQRDEH